jgi:alpha/beta superfamily hydrolase
MAERQIFISSGSLKLEALVDLVDGIVGVVVTHPHPLYGGDMENGVVESIVRAYRSKGYSTLRFNFRGVGMSQGRYEDGRGEQEDVRSAIDFLASHGKTRVDLAGYSFGAWVNALATPTHSLVNGLLLVSPPVAFLDFSAVGALGPLKLVVAGSEDHLARPERIHALLPTWNPEAPFKVIAGADHFYWGYTEELETILADFLDGRRAMNVPRL